MGLSLELWQGCAFFSSLHSINNLLHSADDQKFEQNERAAAKKKTLRKFKTVLKASCNLIHHKIYIEKRTGRLWPVWRGRVYTRYGY